MSHEIVDHRLYRAILHGVAAGACSRAALAAAASRGWSLMASHHSERSREWLHAALSVPICSMTLRSRRRVER